MQESISKQRCEIEGTLEKYIYHNEDTSWSVITLSARKKDKITAVGNISAVQPGETLKLASCWVANQTYGPEFHFDSFLNIMPGTLLGVEKYLSSGLIPGIGPEMAKRMVKVFGLKVLDIIENQPGKLLRVQGIGEIRLNRIIEGWLKHREIKDVMIFLQSLEISPSFAAKIYRAYGNDSIKTLREDPYRIATDVWGIGFKTADKIAEKLGISHESLQRAKAGILYVLGQFSEKGNACCELNELINTAGLELELSLDILTGALKELALQGRVISQSLTGKTWIYLKPLYVSEKGVHRHLERILFSAQKKIKIDIPRAIAWFESNHHIELAQEQKEALASAINEKLIIITGGPGTGKTTLIRAIIEILEKKELAIHLAAPTGRAAKRMYEATRRHAKTIHRLLEFNPSTMSFDRNQERPLKTDLLILDETSMIDIVLFYNVLKALPDTAKLILVGDADQLPSVGPGNVLNDLIASGRLKTVHLRKIFRQARQSLIIVNAHRINNGEMPYPNAGLNKSDYRFISREEPSDALEEIKRLVTVEIPSSMGLDPVNDIQVLTPMHKGPLGVFNLNMALQSSLNKSSKVGIFKSGQRLSIGDKVMQIRNNYDLGIFNGDLGIITAIDPVSSEVEVDFDGKVVPLMPTDLDDITLAYACSIHKSQGSEYPAVVIAMHTSHYIMLKRNLLYTAVTRGKRFVAVVGSAKALSISVKNNTTAFRQGLLKDRLMGKEITSDTL